MPLLPPAALTSCATRNPARPRPTSAVAARGNSSLSVLARGVVALFDGIPFQDLLCYGDLPAVKTKISVFVQLFCDCGLSFITAKRKWTADRLISCAFASRSVIGELATIPNRKNVAIQGVFLLLGSRDRFGRRWGWGDLGRCVNKVDPKAPWVLSGWCWGWGGSGAALGGF